MSSSRLYIGHLSSRANERDIENFFRGYGRIRDIVLKGGFGFVEFEDSRDARDAVDDLNGRELCGERVILEESRRGPRGGGGFDRRREGGGDRGGRGGDRDGRRDRYGPPVQTRYRLTVENLSTRCSWQDLKDLMRGAGDVCYADAHKKEPNTAVVCFGSHSDLKRAIEKFQGKDINGRRIKLIDETENGGGRSRSRSPRSRSRTPRSRTPRSRSRTRSPPRRSESRSASKSPVDD